MNNILIEVFYRCAMRYSICCTFIQDAHVDLQNALADTKQKLFEQRAKMLALLRKTRVLESTRVTVLDMLLQCQVSFAKGIITHRDALCMSNYARNTCCFSPPNFRFCRCFVAHVYANTAERRCRGYSDRRLSCTGSENCSHIVTPKHKCTSLENCSN